MLCKDCEFSCFTYIARNKTLVEIPSNGSSDRKSATVPNNIDEMLQDKITERKMAVCELLCFLDNKFDNHTVFGLKSVVSNFYDDDKIVSIKETVGQCIEPSRYCLGLVTMEAN